MPRVLVIDDDKNIRDLLRIHLHDAGYEVEAAEDCVAAGHALLRRTLSAEAAYRHVPVVFLTSEEEGQERAKGLNVVGFVRKPVRADDLLRLVAKHLPA